MSIDALLNQTQVRTVHPHARGHTRATVAAITNFPTLPAISIESQLHILYNPKAYHRHHKN